MNNYHSGPDCAPLTIEGNFCKFDFPWMATLRDRAYSAQATRRKKGLTNTIPNPPSFYDDDMAKRENRNKEFIQTQKKFKEFIQQSKTENAVTQRQKSRLSTNNFNNVDFEYHGNSSSFSHLIKRKFGNRPNTTQLNFQCRLRSYNSKSECRHKQNWVNAFNKSTKQVAANNTRNILYQFTF